jgi:2-methylcitrate dehydratase PrpD
VDPYAVAFTDWLACACAGANERAARAVRASGTDLLAGVAFAGTAGHVLDFDDTVSDGVAHVSATCAPAALVLAAELGLSLQAALDAYAAGFEAMAAVAAASHPALYEAGWHPTAVCGPIGAAVCASDLLRLSQAERYNAVSVALLRAGGTRGAFGSDGKAIQVGLAAAAGVQGALLARGGAVIDPRAVHGRLGFEGVLGATWPRGTLTEPRAPADAGDGIERNWIKLYPSCLGTHSPIELAAVARERIGDEAVRIVVHPVARQAAYLDDVQDGLSAKFSIPYCVSHTLLHGPPGVRDFADVDARVRERARLVTVDIGPSLPQFGAALTVGGEEIARVPCPRGAPERPAEPSDLAAKLRDLAGDRLEGILDDPGAPAATVLAAAGLRSPGTAQPLVASSEGEGEGEGVGNAAATGRVPSASAANAPSSESAADTAIAGANPSLNAAGDA